MYVKLDLALRSGDDAFAESPPSETARILREVADDIEGSLVYCSRSLRDINGNTVGSFTFEVDED